MFKPLKYQKGGTAASQEQLVQLFQAAAENAQVDPQQLVQKASEIGQDEEAAAQFMQGLQLCAQGDPEGIKFIKSLFQSQAFKKGGKIFEFICKHKKGGYVSGCGCGGNVKKEQDGASEIGFPNNNYQIVRDTTYMNPANKRIMEQIIVGPNEQAYRRTFENGLNPVAVGGYWNDNEFYPEGDDAISNLQFESLFKKATPKKKQTNIVKDQEPAGPIPENPLDSISYYRPGKIVQNNNSFVDSLIGQRFLNLSNVSNSTFVPAPTLSNKITNALRNSIKLSREEGLNRLESVGIPRFIGEDFGKTRRFLEVQGRLNSKK